MISDVLGVTARMLPNNAASKLRVKLRVLLMSATPSANEAVVIDPDRRVGADVAPPRGRVDQHRGNEAPQPGADVEVPLRT